MKLFRWQNGRQDTTEYKKFPFLYTRIGKVGLDGYLLKYQPNTALKPHKDILEGKHYRLNIELWGRGDFVFEKVIFNLFNRVYLFRPDIHTHSVINRSKIRYVLSFGLGLF